MLLSGVGIALSAFLGYPAYKNFYGYDMPLFQVEWLPFSLDSALIVAFAVPITISAFAAQLFNFFSASLIYKSGSYNKTAYAELRHPETSKFEKVSNESWLREEAAASKWEVILLVVGILSLGALDTARNLVGAELIEANHTNATMLQTEIEYQSTIGVSDAEMEQLISDRDRAQDRVDELRKKYTYRNGTEVWIAYNEKGVAMWGESRRASLPADRAEYLQKQQVVAELEKDIRVARRQRQLVRQEVKSEGDEIEAVDNRSLLTLVIGVYLLLFVTLFLSAFMSYRVRLEDPRRLRGGKSTLLSNILTSIIYKVRTFWEDIGQARNTNKPKSGKDKRGGLFSKKRDSFNSGGRKSHAPTQEQVSPAPKTPPSSAATTDRLGMVSLLAKSSNSVSTDGLKLPIGTCFREFLRESQQDMGGAFDYNSLTATQFWGYVQKLRAQGKDVPSRATVFRAFDDLKQEYSV